MGSYNLHPLFTFKHNDDSIMKTKDTVVHRTLELVK